MLKSSLSGSQIDLSLVIPCYRGEAHLRKALPAAVSYLDGLLGDGYEIIVALDGAADGSPEAASAWADRLPDKVRALQLEHRGKGGAVAGGVLAARGRYVIFTDVDLATPLSEIPNAMHALETYHVVIGSRRADGANLVKRQPLHRLISGYGFYFITRALTGLPYRDTQCGFKGFRQEVVRPLFCDLRTVGFTFDVEVLLRARYLGLRVLEMPITWEDQPGTTVRLFRDVPKMALELLTISREVATWYRTHEQSLKETVVKGTW